ncbi:AAA+ family ATPase [Maritimibacter sp. DP1N21-5]|uniref:AAA+ family ATPase n=1 Tax=Maritimibacter sp. DP1N21-5 TaxID=2836867 RepID=UPI001C481371|nr:AAA+ family ATPase [Maritimibacter sp. DP1N21-5]MBV7410480.1 AAA+ family ATPase [Maritimibacter sp. DP1N21-5]
MRKLILIALCVSLALPVFAQSDTEGEQGRDKMSEAFRLLLEGLSEELEPLSRDVADAWREMLEDLDDLTDYEAPERLPNGDIIIRRKTPMPEDEMIEAPEGTEL